MNFGNSVKLKNSQDVASYANFHSKVSIVMRIVFIIVSFCFNCWNTPFSKLMPNFWWLQTRSEAPYKDFFSESDDWIMIIVSAENILALMLPTYIASKFKNLVSILHAGKMYCAKTSSFRFSRRSKWKTVHAFAFLLIHARAIGRSENPGGAQKSRGHF